MKASLSGSSRAGRAGCAQRCDQLESRGAIDARAAEFTLYVEMAEQRFLVIGR